MAQAQRTRINHLPTEDFLNSIPLAHVTEFELSDKETRALRYHIYAINKGGIRRYRTLREYGVVLVWRIK